MNLFYGDNVYYLDYFKECGYKYDLVYADMIYEDKDFDWIAKSYSVLIDNGIFIIQTDYHTVAEVKLFLDGLGMNFINWCIYVQEWGGVPQKAFPRKHDDILIYSKGKDYVWHGDRIQIPKVTAFTKLDKKGTGLKTPCDVFYDLGNFSTLSKERVKLEGKNIQWQKPLKLMDRLLLPFTDRGSHILDPFMGTGSTGVWALTHDRLFTGIEIDPELFDIAEERLREYDKPF